MAQISRNPMQRFSKILLFILFIALPTGYSYATEHITAEVQDIGRIDNTLKIGIESLADRLHDSCFEQPHNNYTAHSRQSKQQQNWRRANDSDKTGSQFATSQDTQPNNPFTALCHTAIATSKHNRGYYIFALRHIII